jgi:hypothetical protein
MKYVESAWFPVIMDGAVKNFLCLYKDGWCSACVSVNRSRGMCHTWLLAGVVTSCRVR